MILALLGAAVIAIVLVAGAMALFLRHHGEADRPEP
jgi:hypothetical protein